MNVEIAKLQEELMALDAAVKHIQKAGEISSEVIESVRNVEKLYDVHLQKVMNYYNEFLSNSYATYEGQVEKVSEVLVSHKQQITEVQHLLDSYLDISQSTAHLSEVIRSVDFPSRLNSIDSEIKLVKTEISNTQNTFTLLNAETDKNISVLSDKINSQNTKTNIILILLSICTLILFYLVFSSIK